MVLSRRGTCTRTARTVHVILLADPAELRGDAAVMYGKLPMARDRSSSVEEFESERVRFVLAADLYLDAILGTGFKPPVSGCMQRPFDI